MLMLKVFPLALTVPLSTYRPRVSSADTIRAPPAVTDSIVTTLLVTCTVLPDVMFAVRDWEKGDTARIPEEVVTLSRRSLLPSITTDE